jgi:hypothetical protein
MTSSGKQFIDIEKLTFIELKSTVLVVNQVYYDAVWDVSP